MLAGQLKDRIQIAVKIITVGPTGQKVEWGDMGYRWATVIPLSIKERIAYQQLNSQVTHKILFRGSLGLKSLPKRFIWGERMLETTETPFELNDWSLINATEVTEDLAFTLENLLQLGSLLRNIRVENGKLIIDDESLFVGTNIQNMWIEDGKLIVKYKE